MWFGYFIKGLRDQIDGYKTNTEKHSKQTIEQTSQYLSTTLLSIADLMGTLFKDSANITTKPDLFYKSIKYRLLAAEVPAEKDRGRKGAGKKGAFKGRSSAMAGGGGAPSSGRNGKERR